MCATLSTQDHVKFYAAIDLGSRNCRLLLSKSKDGVIENLEAMSNFVCLAENLSTTNKLSFEAMERAYDSLAGFKKKIHQYPNVTILAVTTAASRLAENSDLFLKRVRENIGIDMKIISSQEEAHFAALGCTELLDRQKDFALIFDIGGGSTEVIFARIHDNGMPVPIDSISMPLGVVSLAEKLQTFTFKTYNETVAHAYNMTADFLGQHDVLSSIPEDKLQIIGTSGTTTTISALDQNLKFYDRDKVDGAQLQPENIDRVIKHVQLMGREERLLHPCIGQSRDDLILGGLAIFEGIYKALPDLPVTVTDRGVRDGIIYALANHDRFIGGEKTQNRNQKSDIS